MTDAHFEDFLKDWRARIDDRLSESLQAVCADAGCPPDLAAGMRYALLAPGKRLRPLLSLAAIRALGGDPAIGLTAACALEYVHAYSLVHDDLPAMDDDDFRRGQASCHKRFGEAVAILVGDALLTHAFELLALGLPGERLAAAVLILARAAGAAGMVGGQVDDVQPNPSGTASVEEVERIHRRKTARLMEAALQIGGLACAASPEQLAGLGRYGLALGLSFQIADDLLAHERDGETLGRPGSSDEENARRTLPLAEGAAASRRRASELLDGARAELGAFGSRADVLLGLIDLVAGRAGLNRLRSEPEPR